jgi:hypothetical protein
LLALIFAAVSLSAASMATGLADDRRDQVTGRGFAPLVGIAPANVELGGAALLALSR